MGSGGPRGLQILQSGAKHTRGGFDSHTFPPRRFLSNWLRANVAVAAAVFVFGCAACADGAATPPRFRISPPRATLESLALPGLGQLRSGEPVRAFAAFALESYLVTRAVIEARRANDDRDRADAAAAAGDASGEALAHLGVDLHEERRDEMIFWGAIAHMFNMLDAFVAAHLSEVDEEIESVRRLTLHATPSPSGGEMLALSWNF